MQIEKSGEGQGQVLSVREHLAESDMYYFYQKNSNHFIKQHIFY